MSYNTRAGNINRDVLIRDLKLKQDRNTIFFENEYMIVLSPSIQNNSWWFDLLIGNVEKAKNTNKNGLIVLRLFSEILVADLRVFFNKMITEETVVKRENGSDNWKFIIKEKDGGYFVLNQKDSSLEFEVKKVTIPELINIAEDYKSKLKETINATNLKEKEGTYKDKHLSSTSISGEELVKHVHTYLKSFGFLYSKENVKNLYLSLRTKPFVIISGISGTGKTKIVQLFAEAIGATESNGQFKLIPVRSDWSDSSDLLGYKDIKGDFVKGPFTEMVERALDNPELPHFVLLDEMNLARVEYYFSDVLSVMESRKIGEDGNYTSSPLITYEDENGLEKTLPLPGNLYVIGTVNMDETTHSFSKKVLDRANTIEFNEIDLMNFDSMMEHKQVEPLRISNESLESTYIHLKDAFQNHEALIKQVSEKINAINKHLELIYAQVGYRVRDEICFYMIHNVEAGMLLTENEAMDFCIMQKILPRISGTESVVRPVLEGLEKELESYELCSKKINEMQMRLDDNGFVSFWIA